MVGGCGNKEFASSVAIAACCAPRISDGARSNASGEFDFTIFGGSEASFSRIGSRLTSVLPEPVCATQSIDAPFNAMLMASDWISFGEWTCKRSRSVVASSDRTKRWKRRRRMDSHGATPCSWKKVVIGDCARLRTRCKLL